MVACACAAPSEPPAPNPPAPAPPPISQAAPSTSAGPVQIEMKNVRLHLDEGLILNVRTLRGEMTSTRPGEPPIFDDARSYALHVFTGDVGLDMASLTNLMNR